MPIGYGQFVIQKINEIPEGTPIFTKEISDLLVKEFDIENTRAKKIVNTTLNRINGTLIQNYKKGIYYKPKTTVFGKTPLNPMEVTRKMYLNNGNEIIGYETGPSLLQKIGLTTQLPKYRYIATNKYNHNGHRVIEDMKVIIRKPNTLVNKDNIFYLQLIDAIENKDKVNIDSYNPTGIFEDYITRNNIDYGKLIAIAAKNYGKEAILRISDIAVKTRLWNYILIGMLLIGYKRQEEKVRSGGIDATLKIKCFSYLYKIHEDSEFLAAYEKMQDIYVFNPKDKLPINNASEVIKAIKEINE